MAKSWQHEQKKREYASIELEKIKAKLEKLSENEWNKQVGADKGLELAIEVIKDRILELKGENNADSN